jgi:hypothetical protein
MSWPTLIQLHNSEYSHSYDGSEVRETWYVEPWDSVTAFIAAMLGRVDAAADGVSPSRTLPASHFLYPWCFAVACEVVPLDLRQFSYMGTVSLAPFQANQPLSANTQRITGAVQTYTTNYLFPTANIDTAIMTQANRTFSAGAFVTVTYLPLLTLLQGSTTIVPGNAMDTVNYRLVPRIRTNVINSGLKIITPKMAVNLFGKYAMFYPAAGVAPVLKEEYQELVIDRRMLLPTFNLSTLGQYVNSVNFGIETLTIAGVNTSLTFRPQTLRFDSFEATYVQVPQVDAAGNPNGYNRWLNLELHYDWRTTISGCVHDPSDGVLVPVKAPVTWNHVLCYPGTMSWINGLAAGTPTGLGWYAAKYSANSVGVDSDPYPTTRDAVGQGTFIFDTITKSW